MTVPFASVLRGAVLGSLLLGIASRPAEAAVIVKSDSFSPVIQVDGNSNAVTLTVAPGDVPAGDVISDVEVTLDFTKCDDPISSDGTCVGTGGAYAREILFQLTSPDASVVDLVTPDTYFPTPGDGPTPGAQIVVTFADGAATPVGGNSFVSGSFQPVGSLGAYLGQSPVGDWTLFFSDSFEADPLTLNAWTLTITTVPEPSTLALLLGGLLGLAVRRR